VVAVGTGEVLLFETRRALRLPEGELDGAVPCEQNGVLFESYFRMTVRVYTPTVVGYGYDRSGHQPILDNVEGEQVRVAEATLAAASSRFKSPEDGTAIPSPASIGTFDDPLYASRVCPVPRSPE